MAKILEYTWLTLASMVAKAGFETVGKFAPASEIAQGKGIKKDKPPIHIRYHADGKKGFCILVQSAFAVKSGGLKIGNEFYESMKPHLTKAEKEKMGKNEYHSTGNGTMDYAVPPSEMAQNGKYWLERLSLASGKAVKAKRTRKPKAAKPKATTPKETETEKRNRLNAAAAGVVLDDAAAGKEIPETA